MINRIIITCAVIGLAVLWSCICMLIIIYGSGA